MKVAPKPKKAAIYDRWLHTLGGGEQVAFAYALVLKELGFEVTLITHSYVDLSQAERKMGVDLTGLVIRYLPHLKDYELAPYTSEYDVFICNSFADYVPNRSSLGILSIFFPTKMNFSWWEYVKTQLALPLLQQLFIFPTHFSGFTSEKYQDGHHLLYLSTQASFALTHDVKKLDLKIKCDQMTTSLIEAIRFKLNDQVLIPDSSVNPRTNVIRYRFTFSESIRNQPISIIVPPSRYQQQAALQDIRIPSWRHYLYRLFKSFFPVWETRFHGGPNPVSAKTLDSYQHLVAISQFSSDWISRYWQRASTVIYPPVDTTNFKPIKPKRNSIVHVGRFFVGGHSKKQDELIKSFRHMVDQGLKDWELHLIGSVAPGELHQKYLNTVRQLAAGYPIYIHLNAPFKTVQTLLGQAKIYWHATGLGESEDEYPILFEHFGITTVEAMAAGCVPVVINKGGQPEIIIPETGYVWNTREELENYTWQLIRNPHVLMSMSQRAIVRSQDFSRQVFKDHMTQLLTT